MAAAQSALTRDRREAILDAAETVILRDGIDGIRAQSLADEAGISIATPYHYFDSLDAVVEAAYLRGDARETAKRDAALRDAGDAPVEQLRAVLAADFDGATGDVRAVWLLRLEFQRRAIFDERLRLHVLSGEREALDRLARIILAGQSAGSIPALIEPSMIAARLLSLSCGLGALLLVDLITPQQAIALLSSAVDNRADWQRQAPEHALPTTWSPSNPLATKSRAADLLDTTITLIADAGVAGVHFRDVAERANCSLTLPRYYFPTIRALVDAAFARDLEIAQGRMGLMLGTDVTPLDRLAYTYMPRDPAQLAARRPTLVLWVEYLRLGERDTVARASAAARLQGFVDFSMQLGRELADAGAIRPDRVTVARATRMVAVNTGASGLWLLGLLPDADYAAVMNGAIDDEIARID